MIIRAKLIRAATILLTFFQISYALDLKELEKPGSYSRDMQAGQIPLKKNELLKLFPELRNDLTEADSVSFGFILDIHGGMKMMRLQAKDKKGTRDIVISMSAEYAYKNHMTIGMDGVYFGMSDKGRTAEDLVGKSHVLALYDYPYPGRPYEIVLRNRTTVKPGEADSLMRNDYWFEVWRIISDGGFEKISELELFARNYRTGWLEDGTQDPRSQARLQFGDREVPVMPGHDRLKREELWFGTTGTIEIGKSFFLFPIGCSSRESGEIYLVLTDSSYAVIDSVLIGVWGKELERSMDLEILENMRISYGSPEFKRPDPLAPLPYRFQMIYTGSAVENKKDDFPYAHPFRRGNPYPMLRESWEIGTDKRFRMTGRELSWHYPPTEGNNEN